MITRNRILKMFILFLVLTAFVFPLLSQSSLLQSGPMLGPVTLRDVTIWIQTKEKASIQIVYNIQNEKKQKFYSEIKTALPDNGLCVNIHLTNLKPATTYSYAVLINKVKIQTTYPLEFTTQALWQNRTDAPDFTFIAGSCFYINDTEYDRPGKPYGGEYDILNFMKSSKPDFMVWLGDNTYLRDGDLDSRSGIYYRNTHTRSLPQLQPFLASTANYAIWDDHDYGPNDSDWTYALKNHSLQAFKDFWPAESYGAGHTDGVTNSFQWNDCQFFMLDNRWYRTVDTENGTILGEQQKYWLKEALLSSDATYKFICVGGQFLNDFIGFENFSNYAQERLEIIDFIDLHKIKNVVFLTGDRHHSEISKIKTENGIEIYDITSSAITSTTYDHSTEANSTRIRGSMISERNFALFSVSGPKSDRKLSVTFKNSAGKNVYTYDFAQD